jgi:signal peptidase I
MPELRAHLTVLCTGATPSEMEVPSAIEEVRAAHISSGERLSARLWPLLRLVAAALVIALFIRVAVAQPFAIPSGSMAPTLQPGDFVLVDKRAYGWSLAALPLAAPLTRPDGTTPGRVGARPVMPGDVIAFVGPDGRDYVKRVIGRGGDRLELRGGILHLNGVAVPCRPLADGLCRETLPGGYSHVIRSDGSGPTASFGPLLVPEGHYFVLGDNRDTSADSRVSRSDGGVGLVPDAQVMGRAARIFLSVGDGIHWDRIGRPID